MQLPLARTGTPYVVWVRWDLCVDGILAIPCYGIDEADGLWLTEKAKRE